MPRPFAAAALLWRPVPASVVAIGRAAWARYTCGRVQHSTARRFRPATGLASAACLFPTAFVSRAQMATPSVLDHPPPGMTADAWVAARKVVEARRAAELARLPCWAKAHATEQRQEARMLERVEQHRRDVAQWHAREDMWIAQQLAEQARADPSASDRVSVKKEGKLLIIPASRNNVANVWQPQTLQISATDLAARVLRCSGSVAGR